MNYSAPRVIHIGEKGTGNFVQLPYSLLDGLFAKLDGRHGNAIKVMVYLLGLKGDGSFRLSQKWILKRTGMSAQKYYETMQYLEQEGLIERIPCDTIFVNVDRIMEFCNHQDGKDCSRDDDPNGNRDVKERLYDDAYNKEILRKKEESIKIDKGKNVYSDENSFRSILADIGIGHSPYTMKVLCEEAGEEIDPCVLQELIRNSRSAFDYGMTQREGYRFGTHRNLVRDKYASTKRMMNSSTSAASSKPDFDRCEMDILGGFSPLLGKPRSLAMLDDLE